MSTQLATLAGGCFWCLEAVFEQLRGVKKVMSGYAGGHVGTQYRSAIFYHDDEQRRTAEEVVGELEAEHVFDDSIVTRIEPLKAFYPAEEYHREYYRRNPNQPYCRAVIAPKVAKLRSKYLEKLKA